MASVSGEKRPESILHRLESLGHQALAFNGDLIFEVAR
jgi:hypothetical protein